MKRSIMKLIRLFQLLGICLAAATAIAQNGKPLFNNPIGIQGYTYRDSWHDPIAVLDSIKGLGITEYEGGVIRGYTAEQTRKLFEERGIKIVSTGTSFEALTDSLRLQQLVTTAKALGATYVMCAWIPHQKEFNQQDADKAISVFNRAGKVLRDNELTFCYHIHGYEFYPHENGTLFDYMANKMEARYVSFEIDILWAYFGGQDPAKLILQYGDRMKLMHLKDLQKGVKGNLTGLTAVEHDVALGTGQLNIPEILKAAKKVGIKHYFIEDESPKHPEQIPVTIKYLRSLKE
jgi:sugar phosphate isomerase/epimerase